jgi:hypothetical protein
MKDFTLILYLGDLKLEIGVDTFVETTSDVQTGDTISHAQ